MVNNALSHAIAKGYNSDLVGPTVDDDVDRAISRYGADAVKDAVQRLTKPRLGRRPVEDWPLINEVAREDARYWLKGEDPFKSRTNYSIAKAYADQSPGQSHPATMTRVERKLREARKPMMLFMAERISKDHYPHGAHIRALEALQKSQKFETLLACARRTLSDYELKKGELPPIEMSMRDVEDEVWGFSIANAPNLEANLPDFGAPTPNLDQQK